MMSKVNPRQSRPLGDSTSNGLGRCCAGINAYRVWSWCLCSGLPLAYACDGDSTEKGECRKSFVSCRTSDLNVKSL